MLSFKDNPDFEHSRDNTEYKVVVKASDGGLTEWVEYFKVTVTLLDVEEEGEVKWTVDPDGTTGTEAAGQALLEFQAGAILTAAVSDPDGPDTLDNITWKWYRSSSKSATGTMIDGADALTAAYTVSDDANSNDVGMYLRAVATYTDRRGDNKTAEFVSPYPVRPAKVQQNSIPEFAPTAVAREVQEGPAGMIVGAPVTATDADGDVLNYTLDGTDVASFEIDQATGQITTDAALDYDTLAEADRTLTVTVTATDSAGGDSDPVATVTINLLDVNEAPDFVVDPNDATTSIAGMAADKNEEGVGTA